MNGMTHETGVGSILVDDIRYEDIAYRLTVREETSGRVVTGVLDGRRKALLAALTHDGVCKLTLEDGQTLDFTVNQLQLTNGIADIQITNSEPGYREAV